MDESQGKYAEWKKPILKSYVLYDSIYITFMKRQNRDGEEISDCLGLVGGGVWSRMQEVGVVICDPCTDGAVLYPDHGDGSRNLHVIKVQRTKNIHTNENT